MQLSMPRTDKDGGFVASVVYVLLDKISTHLFIPCRRGPSPWWYRFGS